MNDFTNFRAVYDDLTDEVAGASYQFLPDHLRNWFDRLDGTPQVAAIVGRLQHGLDFDGWVQQALTIDKQTKVVGVSRQRINNLVADGVLPRADRGRFDLPSTVQAFFQHKYAKLQACDADAKSLTIERSRLARLKADAAEREAKQEAGELVSVSEVEAGWLAIAGTVRTRILLVPRKIAPRVVTGTAIEAERLMQRELNAALAEIAATPV